MLHLYIDTNAYLSFYHLTSDDLEELRKLIALIDNDQITLHLPEQTFDEFNRNRDVKIADALKRFKEEKLNNQFPQICKDYVEFDRMREAIKEFDRNKSELLKKITEAVFNHSLAADRLTSDLFAVAHNYETPVGMIESARIRYDLGRPPGKNGSYGDAINWETLLDVVPEGEDLYFVSDDKDFYSEIDPSYFNSYLLKEWEEDKSSNIYSYRRISGFLKDKFPEIKIASDYEKDALIVELSDAGNFYYARKTLKKLARFQDFSSKQINEFASACMDNNQIMWIRDDKDIKIIISTIINSNKEKLDKDLLTELVEVYDYLNKEIEA
jgi:predicted nucleic acid-binding protein